jgi:alkyl sulfatase BDS1-like metallo-beta-lactamase superfamily hydrolase
MKNIFVEKMRNVMAAYYELQKIANQKMQENNSTYLPETAKKYNQELISKKEQDFEDAKQEIVKIFEQVKELLAKASYPVSFEMTGTEIFTNPYLRLSDEEITAISEQFFEQGNFTALRFLANWAEEKGKLDLNFHLPKDQILCYKKLAEGALFTVSGIHSEQKDHFIDLEIQTFADPVMCRPELEMIGDGECLKKFKNKEVPEKILHIFDGYALALNDNSLAPKIQFVNPDAPIGTHYDEW